MTEYWITIWCHDCTGEDPQGCFDGGTESISVDPDTNAPITDLERAREIGNKTVRDVGPWDYHIDEYDGKRFKRVEG